MDALTRPLIGVTGPDAKHWPSWNFIRANLWLAGARMVRITPRHPGEGLALDGLIVSGGRDIDPDRYGAKRRADYRYDDARDVLELDWLDRAYRERLPVLGICRGAQMTNVYRGGTLHLDIKLVCESARYPRTVYSKIFARKPVVLKEGSMLHGWFGEDVISVNSLHRQSLDVIGRDLKVTAWEENSIVQAVEGTDPSHFVLGVQWHPEFMINASPQRRLFHVFVDRARLAAALENAVAAS